VQYIKSPQPYLERRVLNNVNDFLIFRNGRNKTN